MAVVKAFKIDGAKLWFWSDDHDPPHFHVKRSGEWEVKVKFLLEPSRMIEMNWEKKRFSRKARKQITDLAVMFRVALLEQWEEIQNKNR